MKKKEEFFRTGVFGEFEGFEWWSKVKKKIAEQTKRKTVFCLKCRKRSRTKVPFIIATCPKCGSANITKIRSRNDKRRF